MPAPSSGNLQVATASYVGATGAVATAVDVASDGTTVVGGVAGREPVEGSESAGGPSPLQLLGGGAGLVARLGVAAHGGPGGFGNASGPGGAQLLSLTRLPGPVEDLRVNASGAIAVCGEFGVAVLDALASAVQWADTPGPVRRCAFGEDGTVAAIVGPLLYVYGPGGALLASWPAGGSLQNDVAIDSQRGLVFATGYSNRRTVPGGTVQVAFLRAWSFSGAPVWADYDPPVERLGAWRADTRGVRVSLGRDGKLYFAAESAGGNSIFTRQPRNVAQGLADEQLVRTDVFTNPWYKTTSNHITWLGRYDPADGTLDKGQFILARLDADSVRGNTIRPRAITADEEGRVYLAGVTTASIHNRDARSISGIPVGPYAGTEAFVLVLQPDFRRRLLWTTFTAPPPSGADLTHDSVATGVGVRNGIAALAATLSRGALLTVNAIPGAGAAPGANAPPGAVSATATSLPRPSSGATATLPGGGAPAGAVPTATSGAALPMPLGPATSGASRGYVAVWPRSAEVDDQSIQGLE